MSSSHLIVFYAAVALVLWPIFAVALIRCVCGYGDKIRIDGSDHLFGTLVGFSCALIWPIMGAAITVFFICRKATATKPRP